MNNNNPQVITYLSIKIIFCSVRHYDAVDNSTLCKTNYDQLENNY